MASYTPRVKEILRAHGCYFERPGRGDHEIWYSAITRRRFPVDGKGRLLLVMELIYCPNCGKRLGFKRALGFGTLFMVLLTFGLWLLVIPFYPARCMNCGMTRRSASWENLKHNPGRAVTTLSVIVGLVLLAIFLRPSDPAPPVATPQSAQMPRIPSAAAPETVQPSAPIISLHEQRLADLKKKREGLELRGAIEREVAKKIARDAMNLSLQPYPDPDERQFLMESMDKEEQRITQLMEQIKAIEAEIAKEEQPPDHEPTSVSEPPELAPQATRPAEPTPAAAFVSPATSDASPPYPKVGDGKINQRDGPLFAFVGTVTNLTNPRRQITAPIRMAFDPAGTCTLTVWPPLIGSGTCTLTQYDERSGHIEIASKGAANILWSGTVKGEIASGTYRVEVTAEPGLFWLTIEHPGSSLAAISRALAAAAKGPAQ